MQRLEQLIVPIMLAVAVLAWILMQAGPEVATWAGRTFGILLVVFIVAGLFMRGRMKRRDRDRAGADAQRMREAMGDFDRSAAASRSKS